MTLEDLVRAVGVTSITLAGAGLVAPRGLASVAGVVHPDADVLPVLVRLNAARQGVVGVALLTRTPIEVRRNANLFLPLTALDLGAVALGVRSGALARRSLVMATAVLVTNIAVSFAERRRRS